MDEFNQFSQEGKAYIKSFPEAKAKQLNHHATAALTQHQYDSESFMLGLTICLMVRV